MIELFRIGKFVFFGPFGSSLYVFGEVFYGVGELEVWDGSMHTRIAMQRLFLGSELFE